MKPDYETVRNQALKLSDEEKAKLVLNLEGSFSEEYLAEIQQSWVEELHRRREQLESGEVETISLEDLKSNLGSTQEDVDS